MAPLATLDSATYDCPGEEHWLLSGKFSPTRWNVWQWLSWMAKQYQNCNGKSTGVNVDFIMKVVSSFS